MDKETKLVENRPVRFNLERALDAYAWEIINNLDTSKFKSGNAYIVKAIVAYHEFQKNPPLTEAKVMEIVEKAVKESIRIELPWAFHKEMEAYVSKLSMGSNIDNELPEEKALEETTSEPETQLDPEVLSFLNDLKLN